MKEDFLRPEPDVEDWSEDLNVRLIFYIGKVVPPVVSDLQKMGYHVVSIEPANGWKADLSQRMESLGLVSSVIGYSIDAVICEFTIDGMDAFAIFKEVQRHELLKMASFILIGNAISEVEVKRAFTLGINDVYHTYNVTSADLYSRIQVLKTVKDSLRDYRSRAVYEKFSVRIRPQKRIFDIVCSFILILLFSPVMALISLLIWLESRGPILYVSPRVGTGYQIFDFYKFRSMRPNADKELDSLKHLNQYNGNGKKSSFIKLHNDPRITRIGKFIRKTSLDELPQLFNVLKGDMSLVGNRPLPLYEAEQLTTDLWAKRFLAPAGITGLWQVTKRGKKDMSDYERMLLDVDYADKTSLWFDLEILIRTVGAVIQKESV